MLNLILPACLVLGLFAGLMGGMLGIGGGVIIVPCLIFLFSLQQIPPELIPQMAVATSLCSIIITSSSAIYAQAKRGAVDWVLFRQWVWVVIAGGFCSGFIAKLLPALVMQRGIALFLMLVAVILLSQWQPHPSRRLPGPPWSHLLGFGSSMSSGLAGIGGGNIIVPLLIFFNVPMLRAAATASALGLPIALVGTLGFVLAGWQVANLPDLNIGFVYWPAAVAIGATAFISAPWGVAIAHRLPAKTLKRIFGALLLMVSGSMMWSSFFA
jgi:uncharacterized membrane protein YfcA